MAYQLERLAEQVGAYVEHAVAPDRPGEARLTGDALVADAEMRAQSIRNDIDALIGEMRRQTPERRSPAAER